MNGFRSLLLPVFIAGTIAPQAFSEELELVERWFVKAPYELSGLAMRDGKLLTVSDEKEHTYIFEVQQGPDKKEKALKVFVDLKTLAGYPDVLERLKESERRRAGTGRFDLEGIAICGDDIYLANERAHLIHRIRGKTIETLALNWGEHAAELDKGGINTGFEGVAVDCKGQMLYIAKEREARMIYVWNLDDLSVKHKFDLDASPRDGQRYLNPDESDGLVDMERDFADLYVEDGFLYAVLRNTRELAKIDAKEKKVIARYSYLRTEWGLYDTPLPFGQTEGLVMDKDFIYLAIDNNQNYLTHAAEKTYGIKGNPGFIGKFRRPKGF